MICFIFLTIISTLHLGRGSRRLHSTFSFSIQEAKPSGINLVPELITLAISVKTDYDSHLLIKHAITPVNQRILKNDVILALM